MIKFKRHTNHLISSINCVCFTTFSYFILFYNVNNNSKKFHELQIYLNSYIHIHSYIQDNGHMLTSLYFVTGSHSKTTYDPGYIEFKWSL
jgi:hypothetical protein